MRKIVLAAAAISMFVGAASAADLPARTYTKAPPPPPPPVLSWSGWYAGLNAGGIWSNDNGVAHTAFAGPCNPAFPGCNVVPNTSMNIATASTFVAGFGNNAGFTGGGQFGYNWQFNGSGVVGFESDIAWTGQNRSVIFNSSIPAAGFRQSQVYSATISRNLDYIGTVRGRLGFLATPAFLLYGTGGLAYGGARSSTLEATAVVPGVSSGVGGGSFSDTRVGWTAGAGAEWMFAPNWSAKVEGLYYDLGRVSYGTALQQICPVSAGICAAPGAVFGQTTGVTSMRFTGAIARVGVNYHFGGPVVAKY